ncbi:MAG: 23S rRNA (pseudouridine(1915)-N(3))-methyltransferase RlmH [Gammaproteobacteria bacterium]|nr:23S rRNA (pseudouridine(1915)-N(3))-methyltransferase RlmH [Gammaproteobacteria bacterium]
MMPKKIMRTESQTMINMIKPHSYTIALDSRGKHYSSEALSKKLNEWQEMGKTINILIGGPEGYTEETLKKSDMQWSLSYLTFAHPIVRIILAEQLYRAHSILKNHPYHRE